MYFYEDVAKYSKGFQGAVVTLGWGFGLLAVLINASFLKGVRYRWLFIGFQVIQALVSSLDLLLVCVAKDAFWCVSCAARTEGGAVPLPAAPSLTAQRPRHFPRPPPRRGDLHQQGPLHRHQ